MTLADKLNAARIYPDFTLRTQERAIEFGEYDIHELGCYAPYPLEDAKIYVYSTDGQTARWGRNGQWVNEGSGVNHSPTPTTVG